jgi:hypothetical protein
MRIAFNPCKQWLCKLVETTVFSFVNKRLCEKLVVRVPIVTMSYNER